MHEDFSLNLDQIEPQARWFKKSGMAGVFVVGSTGEYQTLTTDERIRLSDRWQAASRDHALKHIVHVGHADRKTQCQLAEHAREIRASAIAISCSEAFEEGEEIKLVEYCSEIAACASGLPVYYYHVPQLTGLQMPMATFLSRATRSIPNLTGLVYAVSDLEDLQRCLINFDVEIQYAHDESLLAAYALGVHGAIGSSYNYLGAFYLQMIDAMQAGEVDAARSMQREAHQITDAIVETGFIAAGKYLMKEFEIQCGPTRNSTQNVEPKSLDRLIRMLLRDFPNCFATKESPRISPGAT
jgi:N-acetylneuraminate lyase